MKNVLILYGFEHSGHHAAALAMREAFRTLDPGLEVQLLNFFAYASRTLERVSTTTFFCMVKNIPGLWDGIYHDPRSETRFSRFRRLVRTLAPRGAEDVVRRFRPDAVVCTQALPCGMLHDFKEEHDSDLPLYAVLTDYFVPSYWVYRSVNAYCVASGEAGDELVAEGIPRDIVLETGIPISPRFSKKAVTQEARRAFGLHPEKPTVLIAGGWNGWGELERLAREIRRMAHDCQVVVVTGRNRERYEALKRYAASDPCIAVMEYVSRMDVLMQAADLLVGKAGGMTSSEALASGLPLVLVDMLPGQELMNARYLTRQGAAVMTRGAEEAAAAAAELILNHLRRKAMGHCALRSARPRAAVSIAEMVMGGVHVPAGCV